MIIESNIPMPERRKQKSKIVDLLKTMKVGDSIGFPSRSKAAQTVHLCKQLKYKVALRSMPDGTLRLWRTEENK